MLLFALGGVLASIAADLALPALSYGLRAQLVYFNKHRRDYDVLAIGSSFTLRNLDPSILDEELRRSGYPVRTFVFGVENYGGHAINRLIRVLSSMAEDQKFALALVETREFSPRVPPRDYAADVRDIWWHDLAETKSILGTTLKAGLDRPDKTRTLRHHLVLLGLHYVPVGRVSMLASESEERKYDLALQSFHGHLPFRIDHGQVGDNLEPYLADPELWRERVEGHQARLLAPPSLKGYPVRAITRQVACLKRWTLPVYINYPVTAVDGALGRRLRHEGHLPYLLDFSDPERPGASELWRLQNHFDATHLNDAGTGIFTRKLALDLVRLADSSPEVRSQLTHATGG